MSENYVVRCARQPEGVPRVEDFSVEKTEAARPDSGQLLCRTRFISLDPYLRSRLAGRHMSGSIAAGDAMDSELVLEVLESDDSRFAPGALVRAHGPWQREVAIDPERAAPVDPSLDPPSLALGVAGMPGLTAYAGMRRLAEPKRGETVVVSAASGPVGSMVGQIARIAGCRVVGVAGSQQKCDWATQEAGMHACVNYREQDVREGLRAACPDGIDVYFDNVGGDMLCAAMEQLAMGARVVLCGLISIYNDAGAAEQPPLSRVGLIIRARATVRGLVVYDHEDLRAQFEEECGAWLARGEVRYLEDVAEGIERAPEAFCRLMSGKNFGKALVKVS